METVEYMWVNIRCMLIAPAKIPLLCATARLLVTQSFIQQMKEMRTWGRSLR